MLTAVHVINEYGSTLELPMDALGEDSEFVIQGIDGLGPVKAEIATATFVTVDGGAFQASRGGMRNIVLLIGFNPSFGTADPYGELRRSLYNYFTPQSRITTHFLSSNLEEVKIEGWVEACEPSIFSREPQVQVSIICPDPYFYAVNSVSNSRTGNGALAITNPSPVSVGFTVEIINSKIQTSRNILVYDDFATMPFSKELLHYNGPGTFPSVSSGVNYQFITIPGKRSGKYSSYATYDPLFPNWGNNDLAGYVLDWGLIKPGISTLGISVMDTGETPVPTVKVSITPRYMGL